MEEVHPNTLEKNYEALKKEWNDVIACAILVEEENNLFDSVAEPELLDMKFAKIEKYRSISKGNGRSHD